MRRDGARELRRGLGKGAVRRHRPREDRLWRVPMWGGEGRLGGRRRKWGERSLLRCRGVREHGRVHRDGANGRRRRERRCPHRWSHRVAPPSLHSLRPHLHVPNSSGRKSRHRRPSKHDACPPRVGHRLLQSPNFVRVAFRRCDLTLHRVERVIRHELGVVERRELRLSRFSRFVWRNGARGIPRLGRCERALSVRMLGWWVGHGVHRRERGRRREGVCWVRRDGRVVGDRDH